MTPMGRRARNLPFSRDLCRTSKSRRSAVCAFIRFSSELSPTPTGVGRRLHIKPAVGDKSLFGSGDHVAGTPAPNFSNQR